MFIQTVTFGSPAYDELVALRYEVLRKPLGLEFAPQDIAKEYKDQHFGLYDDQYQLLATALLHQLGDGQAQMKQVAVRPEYQGQGLGKKLIAAFEQYASQAGFELIKLEARDNALGFYRSLGYEKIGEPYQKIGILHHDMQKSLL